MDPSEILSNQQVDRLRLNLASVRKRMADAALRSGRKPQDVGLVAVTKRTPIMAAVSLWAEGVEAVGESRPEELVRKGLITSDSLQWHLIGPLQTKKIKRILPHTQLIHSVDSVRLARNISDRVEREGLPAQDILLQINISGEEAKQGLTQSDAPAALDAVEQLHGVRARGLMTMAPHEAHADLLAEVFGGLHQLQKNLGVKRVPELSMGMSGDFELAIEHGATLVRVGSALFEGLDFTG